MKSNSLNIAIICCIVYGFLTSCTGVKYLPEGERFFSRAEIIFKPDSLVENSTKLKEDLRALLNPDPNDKILGSRPGAWFYYVAGEPKKEKGFRHWVKYKLGQKPVLMSDFKHEQLALRLRNYLINHGYFHARVEDSLKLRNNMGRVYFNINTGPAYRIREINYPETDSVYKRLIDRISTESLIRPGMIYDLEKLKAEQDRIENYVEDRGFYYFDDNYLIYNADSTVGNHQVDLTLTIAESTPDEATVKFKLGEIIVNPDYSINETDSISRQVSEVKVDGYTFINNDDYVKPKVLAQTIVLNNGFTYTQQAEQFTRERLMALGIYKFVNVKFNRSDSSTLETQINLTPLPKKSLRFELQAISKSNNFVGPALSVSFLNRNAFRGAELLKIAVNTSYDIQIGGQNKPPLNAFELNVESSLTIPRFIAPFNIDYSSKRFIPATKIVLGTRLQERLNVFRLTSFETKFGYQWQETLTKRHQLFPINISYVELNKVSSEFDERLSLDPNLSRSLEDQFIVGATYEYTFSSRNSPNAADRKNHYYFNGLIDVSGNLFYLTQQTFGDEVIENRNPGTTYSQYAKAQIDFRHYRSFGTRNVLASRLIFGIAHAYGNSTEVPFIKQFSSGGANGLRAFRARSVGPGSYDARDEENANNQLILDETGDIKMEGSVEYRSKLIGVIDGALFVDAGNIWLINDDEPSTDQMAVGSKTISKQFISEFAVGAGAGIRLDFNFFVLRFDLAFPIRKPWLPEGNRWVINEVNPLDKSWRRENLLLNIAIGYPF